MSNPNLKDLYYNKVVPEFIKSGEFKNVLACPRIEKVTLNVGIAKYRKDEKKVSSTIYDLSKITGQKPVISKARKSIAGFSVRKGDDIGVKVTLRKNRMYNFLWMLLNVALPRTRDFKGINLKSIDRAGNLTIGLKEHTVFPEIKGDEVKHIFGFEVCISVNKGCGFENAIKLYRALGFPLTK